MKTYEDIAERGRQLRAEAGRRSSLDKMLVREEVGEMHLSEEVAREEVAPRRSSSLIHAFVHPWLFHSFPQ